MLCYVTSFYIMLYYVILCYVILCYIMLCYGMLYYVMLCTVLLCYALQIVPLYLHLLIKKSNLTLSIFSVMPCLVLFSFVLVCCVFTCPCNQPDCDPHPGNLACDSELGGRLIFYDFGTSAQ